MAIVAIAILPAKFCTNCNGTGWFTQDVTFLGSRRSSMLRMVCQDCDGTGDVPADYFIEIGTVAAIDDFIDHLNPMF